MVFYTFAEPAARVIGATEEHVELRTQSLREAGLWFEDEHADLARTDQIRTSWDGFVSSVDVEQTLHAEGRFERILGKDRPVLLYTDLERGDSQRALNQRANPARFQR